MDIKEIALKVASEMPQGFIWSESCGHESGILIQEAIDFAEALVAEIAKGNEPVTWMYEYSYDLNGDKQGNWPVEMHTHASFSRSKPSAEATPLYTLPPAAHQIEQETAEACARYVAQSNSPEHRVELAEGIRSGNWRKFVKGE